MLRKLTSLLFKEEEIIIEEEEHEVEEIKIPELKPLQTQETTTVVVEETQTQPKKSFRIDIDGEPSVHQKPVMKPQLEKARVHQPYTSKEVISPIHGGPAGQSEPLKPAQSPNVKKRVQLTEVISPMYGKVAEPAKETENIDLSLLEMDVESMITPEFEDDQKSEEVQTSLFDYLEGDETREG